MINKNSLDALPLLKEAMTYAEQEQVVMMTLTGMMKVKSIHFVGLGSHNAVIICKKIIAKHAVMDMASNVIIAHNHPSGNPRPSKADIEQTEELRDALKVLEISLTDHIIVSDGCYYSFAENKTLTI